MDSEILLIPAALIFLALLTLAIVLSLRLLARWLLNDEPPTS